jgi:NAD(P)-dependent dehydrogenase (short-subunit alcohol dehydrogenase family)
MDNGGTHEALAGLRAVVTGGTSGLGLALVRALRAAGAEVAFVARSSGRVAEVAHEKIGRAHV